MRDLMFHPDLTGAAEQHLRLVMALERLADMGGDPPGTEHAGRADLILVKPGDAVLIQRMRTWRAGIVVELGVKNDPRRLRVAWLAPSALDHAQQTWMSQAQQILQEDYPQQQAALAREKYEPDATATRQAGQQAHREAVFAQAVARGCLRRPWAAAVPIQYTELTTSEVYLYPDQTLACPPAA